MTHPPTPGAPSPRGSVWVAFLIYLAFVVYGSLVPFELRPLAWDQALDRFQRIPYLALGVDSRADWIANIVLYVPLAFLGCSALLGMRRPGWWTPLGLALVAGLCVAVAVGVEFTQQWFAPRTVSLNDLIAETIGTLIGILFWVFGRGRVAWGLDAIRAGGRTSVLAALLAGGLGYLLLSFFPYDFVVSADEWRGKLAGGNQGWLLASGCGGALRCGAGLAIEALAVAPLGLLAILLWPGLRLRTLFLCGVLAGLILEPLQLLLASGVTQGLSVLMRGCGLVLGALAGELLERRGPRPVARLVVLAAPLLVLPYVAGMLLVSGWFRSPAVSGAAALARLAEVRWLPLYYQYFTTESAALTSALAQLGLYFPFGLLAWALVARRPGRRAAGPWLAAGLVIPISLLIEGGKLFFPPEHPDPSNVLIAVIAALLAYGLAAWFERVLTGAPAGGAARRVVRPWEDAPAAGLLPAAPVRSNAAAGGWDRPSPRNQSAGPWSSPRDRGPPQQRKRPIRFPPPPGGEGGEGG